MVQLQQSYPISQTLWHSVCWICNALRLIIWSVFINKFDVNVISLKCELWIWTMMYGFALQPPHGILNARLLWALEHEHEHQFFPPFFVALVYHFRMALHIHMWHAVGCCVVYTRGSQLARKNQKHLKHIKYERTAEKWMHPSRYLMAKCACAWILDGKVAE